MYYLEAFKKHIIVDWMDYWERRILSLVLTIN